MCPHCIGMKIFDKHFAEDTSRRPTGLQRPNGRGGSRRGERREQMKKPELLAPAGNLEKLKTAFLYGADAVYIGGEAYSLRAAADNFTYTDMREGIAFAHARGGKVYLTANVIPHNRDIEAYKDYLRAVKDFGFDGVIVSDLGVFSLTREIAPALEVHISTQANNVNYQSACVWHQLGAKRVILARSCRWRRSERSGRRRRQIWI